MDRYARWNALVELRMERGQVTVEEAAAELDVSLATIRRDFEQQPVNGRWGRAAARVWPCASRRDPLGWRRGGHGQVHHP